MERRAIRPLTPWALRRAYAPLLADGDDLDAAGVPKFDFLGLGGLSAVHLAFDAIERRTGEKLALYTLPVDDARTYEMIARGDTVGTFQIESRAQIQSILATKPERLYDIVVQVALIRPGPIQAKFVHPYTERRRGREAVRGMCERACYPRGIASPRSSSRPRSTGSTSARMAALA